MGSLGSGFVFETWESTNPKIEDSPAAKRREGGFNPGKESIHLFLEINQRDEVALVERIGLFATTGSRIYEYYATREQYSSD